MKSLHELVIELTDRCPLSCKHCSSNSNPSCSNVLRHETVLDILDQAAALQTRQISFGGGEPTIAPYFLETLQNTIRLGFATEVFTCGAVFDEMRHLSAFSRDFVKELASLGKMLTLVFSFHGSHDAVHDSITGVPNSFEYLLDSVRKCLDRGISCTANYVPTRMNAYDFPGMIILIKRLGIIKLSVLRFVPQGRGFFNRDMLELSREEENYFVSNLVDLREKSNLEIRTGSPFNEIIPDNNVPCRAGFQKLVIQPDGNVLPCEVFKQQGRREWGASVYEIDLEEILDLPQFVAFRNTMKDDHCAICPIHSQLRAGQSLEETPRGLPQAAV